MTNDTAEIMGTLAVATPWAVYGGLSLVTKAGATIALGAAAVAVVLAVIRKMSNGPRSGLLTAVGAIGLLCGVLGAAYGGLNGYIAARELHVTRLVIVLPTIIECAYVLSFGVLAWVIAQVGNAGAKRR